MNTQITREQYIKEILNSVNKGTLSIENIYQLKGD